MLRPKPRRLSKQARLLIEEAEALGEPPEDPLLLFSVLYGFWVASYVAFNGDAMRTLRPIPGARREAERDCPAHDRASPAWAFPCCDGRHRGRPGALDRALALYDPAEHRPLATRFGQDARGRSSPIGRGLCGCLAIPRPPCGHRSRTQAMRARRSSRNVDVCAVARILTAHLTAAITRQQTLSSMNLSLLADEKGSLFWKASECRYKVAFALTGKAAEQSKCITAGIAALRSTGNIGCRCAYHYLAIAHAELGQLR